MYSDGRRVGRRAPADFISWRKDTPSAFSNSMAFARTPAMLVVACLGALAQSTAQTITAQTPATPMQVDSISMLQADLMNAAGPATILMKPGRYDVSEELLIERDVTIQAAIPPSTDGGGVELNGRGINRVLKVVNGHAKLIGIRITGGHATDQGAGIWAQNSDVRLTECSVDNNHVIVDQGMADGGGIYAVGGSLHLSYTRVWNNTAETVGGGIRVVATETASQEVPVTFDHVHIGHNRARSDVGGAALSGVDLRMSFVNVSHNTARDSVGGMTIDGKVAIEHLTVQDHCPEGCAPTQK